MTQSVAPPANEELAKVAEALRESLQKTYPDARSASFGSTITISRGKPAVQIAVMGTNQFTVSVRMRETFHMKRKPVVLSELAEVVRQAIGEPS